MISDIIGKGFTVFGKAVCFAAETGDAAKAKLSVQSSSVIRMLVMAALYIVILKSGKCDPLAAILPLVFVQISISVTEFFRKEAAKSK